MHTNASEHVETAAGGLPDDPGLPGLTTIRRLGLAVAIPALGLGADETVELRMLAHKPGRRAAILAVAGGRRTIIKINAKDVSDEAALHRAFAELGLTGARGDRVPAVLCHDPSLHIIVQSFLEGPEAGHLLRHGQGERAAGLAAGWLRRVATLPLAAGRLLGVEKVLKRARKWVAALGVADGALGRAAETVEGLLTRTTPSSRPARLVHGTFHDRNVLDLGDGAGVIDWQRSQQGPTEFDAGTFLASIARVGLHDEHAQEAIRAEAAFLEGIEDLVEPRSLRWHRGAALLCLADRVLTKQRGDWLARAHGLVCLAATFVSSIT
jgi:aminoglycoside phosphotransferase (APT) family kinase protein